MSSSTGVAAESPRPAGLEVGVLGPLELRRAGTVVPIGAPKLRALLSILVLDLGRAVPSDRLVEDLWGADPPPQPMVSLRSYVSNLRRLLQDPSAPPLIATRSRGYALELAADRVDAVRFEQLARDGHAALVAGEPARAIEHLDRSLGLWRGGAYADVADQPYATPSITRLDALRLTAVEDRIDAFLALGSHVEVVPELEAHAREHPLRERPQAALVVALYRCGRTPDALAVHARFRTVLADELGLDPSPEFSRLADRVLRRDGSLDAPAAGGTGAAVTVAGERPSTPDSADSTATAPSPSPPPAEPAVSTLPSAIVGRVSERHHLEAAVDAVAARAGGVTLLAGEPGIGKTAMLHELSRLAAVADVPVAWGRCLEADGAPAFWPWVEVIRGIAARLDDAALAAATVGSAAAVGQLVPDVGARVGLEHAPPTGDPDLARFALYDAVTTFLERAAHPRGLVVILDDLHWGDVSTLQLLHLLAGRAAAARIRVAGSFRDTPSERSEPLEAALAGLARESATTTLRLSALDDGEAASLVASLVGDAASDGLVDEVHRRAGGNPFFIRQLAALVTESDDGGTGRTGIPVGVRHVLLRRLGRLAAPVRATLEIAAVLGQTFDVRTVAAAAGVTVLEVLDHVDEAIQHGLVEVGADRASAYGFVHALVRETITDELAPGRSARLHAAVADALERLEPVPVAAVADHLWQALEVVPAGRAAHYLRLAAEEALAVLAYEQAEDQLRRALHLLAHEPAAGADEELAVRLRLTQVVTSLKGWTAVEIEEVSGRVRDLARTAGIGPELVPLWWSLWTMTMTRAELDTSLSLATELLAAARDHDDPRSLLAGHLAVAYARLFRGDRPADLQGHLDGAMAALAVADPDGLGVTPEHLGVSVHVCAAIVAALTGDQEATLQAGDAIVTYAECAPPFSQAYARLFAGWTAAVVDRPDVALRHADAGLAACDRAAFRYVAQLIVPVHGWAVARLGGDAREQAARVGAAAAFLEFSGHHHALGQWVLLLAEIHGLAGDVAAAHAALARAEEIGERTGERVYAPQLARVREKLSVTAER